MNDIFSDAKKNKQLTKHDVPKIKHWYIMLYGESWWSKVDLDEFKNLFGKSKPRKEESPKEKVVDRRGGLIDTFIKTQPRTIVPRFTSKILIP